MCYKDLIPELLKMRVEVEITSDLNTVLIASNDCPLLKSITLN